MSKPFRPILDAVAELGEAVIGFTHCHIYQQPERERRVQAALAALRSQIDRLHFAGLPECREPGVGGQRMWKYDLNETLEKLVQSAHELVEAARRVPPWGKEDDLHVGAEADVRPAVARNETVAECIRLGEALQQRWNSLWALQDRVAEPQREAPGSIPAAQIATQPTESDNQDGVRPARDCDKAGGKHGAKRSTERDGGQKKLVAALTKHHQYADGGCLNLGHIGNNELAELAVVSISTASKFFKDEFGGHDRYVTLCRDSAQLVAALKLLNGEVTPRNLYGRRPTGEDNRDDD